MGEPIAIVGMACKFPGASDLDSFWGLLESGGNAVTKGDLGAGVGRLGEIFRGLQVQNEACRYGAFVEDIDRFDAAFFRISPVEAELLDPQQRMMLEASWLALEDAAIDPMSLKGSRTGVYTGISNDEYRMLVVESSGPAAAAGSLYALSGTNLNGASGRVSFVLGLTGPAKAVDAACASALVAVDDAVSDLQQGKADLAIAGGVQAILNGRIYELRAESMMLSPDGQCKTFDASADGYVRGEGCGVVVLKRLRDAEAAGDRIWAVIRGSAVNHGGAGIGLTVPHTPALEQVMETALLDAGVCASDVDYVEAHGTGTAVGDPIELEAVSSVYTCGRQADQPLLIGSVKTNLGHLESAAGIAGLIKAAMVVKQGVIPKHLHFHNPNPDFSWEGHALRVTDNMMDWPRRDERPRLAGVNSFGISGTNAHLVVEEYRDVARDDGQDSPVGSARRVSVSLNAPATVPSEQEGSRPRVDRFLPLSGKSESAVKELAGRYLSWLDNHAAGISVDAAASGPALSDMSWTASVGRSHFDFRAGVVFRDVDSLRDRLNELATSDEGVKQRNVAKVAFAYTGQGSQWDGMGRSLYETEPVAQAVLDRCEKVFQEERGSSLLDVMFGREGAKGDLGNTAWEQPALYALQCALTALWDSAGVRPSVVLGHSVGEIAASQAAGVFSLEDGMRFATIRGALLSDTEQGAMGAIFATRDRVNYEVKELNEETDGVGLSIAADNGAHIVVSGAAEEVETLLRRFKDDGARANRLNTGRAFHSALVEPALDELERSLDGVTISVPTITVVSNLTGEAVGQGMALDPVYWRRHAREPVAFADGIKTLAELGVDLIVELGPHAVLGPMATLAWPDGASAEAGSDAPTTIASLRRPPRDGSAPNGETGFIDAVAEAYEVGVDIAFEGLFAGEERRRVSLPGYPFQRERHWLQQSKQRRASSGHPLLGVQHEPARGGTTFETHISPSDPAWLNDHKVFGRVIAPGALYGAMAASACFADGDDIAILEDVQIHYPMVFPEQASQDVTDQGGRTVQVVLDGADQSSARLVQVYSKGPEGEWTTHVEGRVLPGNPVPSANGRVDLGAMKERLSPSDVPAYYRAKASTGIDLGPHFQTLGAVWSGPGEALSEVRLPKSLGRNDLAVHPLLLDGCFQVVGVARNVARGSGEATYLPFGWDRMWLSKELPDGLYCHVTMSEDSLESEADSAEPAEVLSAELRIYDSSGTLLGEINGYTVKQATEAALLATLEGVNDLIYQVIWRDRPLESGILPADFLPNPTSLAAGAKLFPGYLTDADVDPQTRNALLDDLERWSWARALATLEELGWQRVRGQLLDPEELRERLTVLPEHSRLFRRMLEMVAKSGVLEESGDGFAVVIGQGDLLPDVLPSDLEEFAVRMTSLYADGLTEIGLFQRSGLALGDVLRGQEDPLTLLFSSGEPTAADLYLKAPVARAANRMLADAVQALVANLPEGRRLRVIEVGAGTGSATASVLRELPQGRFDYTYTDISAGFFAEAEARFGDGDGSIEYLTLDIEKDPVAQGFDAHGYDLVIASNVLHATRYLNETLANCGALLAPSGHLVALENLRGLGWMDLTFGQLDGWWRFADSYRANHALASPAIWSQALGDAGFQSVEVLGVDDSFTHEMLDKGVIVAQGPTRVTEAPGLWVLTDDGGGFAVRLAEELAARNQTVVVAGNKPAELSRVSTGGGSVTYVAVDTESREGWRLLMQGFPEGVHVSGVAHLQGVTGRGLDSTVTELTDDIDRIGASALALAQGMLDSDVQPDKGVWFVTRGAQVLERERAGELAGAVLWGLGKVIALEATNLKPRMIDLDPIEADEFSVLANELLYPDSENHICYRAGRRQTARLVRHDAGNGRLELPEGPSWVLAPNRAGVFDEPEVKQLSMRPLEPKEVRVTVDATGMNFWDVFRSLGFIEEGDLGREMCGYVAGVGADVSTVSVGDRVVGLGFGAFGAQMVTREELVAPAPEGTSVSALATIPSAFVSAALSFKFSGLMAGERVLIHAGAGGVGLAAIQLAQAAGAEVHATASAPKQALLRSLGVRHIYDSRQTRFGEEILETTNGEGVHVVLNSLTGEGFIDASLACLARGGRFVEMARRDILSEAEMAAARPDVSYHILELDVMKKTDPAAVGVTLREVMAKFSSGELTPIVHSRWPLAEAGAALDFMRSARHVGKIVLTPHPLTKGQLRQDRTYLVTGGLGGIGCAVANWLADRGAETIVLNGRREPSAEAQEAINALRGRGVRVEVELADMTDTAAIDAMLDRMDAQLPPLGGVIHSVGVLSDAALNNQTWKSFQRVLWPKVIGAWHLHRATMDRDLDLFILFSSRVGVMGNPGQANHAAANAFLDQLAGHRRALGLPGQAIAWGAWSEIGEAAEQKERIERRRAALGGRWFTPQQGINALDQLVRQDITTSVVMSMDWSVFGDAVADRPALVEDLLSPVSNNGTEAVDSAEDIVSRLRGAPAGGREELLVSFVQQELQAVLRLPTTPPPNVGFFDLGMDSLMSVELRNRLNRTLAGEYVVSNTAVFDYPNAAALAKHLAGELTAASEPALPQTTQEPASAEVWRDAQTGDNDIAIVGMACRFPGAPDLDSFWNLLTSGRDAITDGRTDDGPWDGVVGDPSGEDALYRTGGFVEGIDRFDSKFFRISPIEARMMDPQQRMLLETAWQALEDAGINPDTLRGSLTGVYVGIGGSQYREIIAANGQEELYFGTTGSMAAGRLAFVLGLEGPAMPVDMACASSLAAVHQAAAALQRGEVDLALAGGVNVILSQSMVRFHHELGMLSAAGRCNAFDASADGFVRSEGCGVLALKRLSEAEADGDRVWAVVKGSAVNQNGASAGLPVPRGPAQERLIEGALARAGVQPREVDYVEAHGAGTELGDSIELNALASVYGREREAERPLLVGSVKTNIGHSEWSAGMASLMKAVLAMNKGVIPAHLHFQEPNPNFDWDRLPVRITSEPTAWPMSDERPALSAVNSFGLSGSNAHVIVQGHGTPAKDTERNGQTAWPAGQARSVSISLPSPFGSIATSGERVPERTVKLLPVSAKSRNALSDLAVQYLAWLDDRDAEHSSNSEGDQLLANMAWTAATGRSHFAHRAGLVFRDVPELRTGLEALAKLQGSPDDTEPAAVSRVAFVYSGQRQLWAGVGEGLYLREPVFRSVLDRCEETAQQERGESLLGLLFGGNEELKSLNDSRWALPAMYALEAALTALWRSVGITPVGVLGTGIGEVSAALAAGALGLDDGLRLAMALGNPEASLPTSAVTDPSMMLVSSETGRAMQRGAELTDEYWRATMLNQDAFPRRALATIEAGADVVVALGLGTGPEWIREWGAFQDAKTGDSPSTLDCLLRPRSEPAQAETRFLHGVATAYEAGLAISFEGLFAGEQRRRIRIPGYPFQRRSFWVQKRRRGGA